MNTEQLVASLLEVVSATRIADQAKDPRDLAQRLGCRRIYLVQGRKVTVRGLVEAHWDKGEWAAMWQSMEAGRFTVTGDTLHMEV